MPSARKLVARTSSVIYSGNNSYQLSFVLRSIKTWCCSSASRLPSRIPSRHPSVLPHTSITIKSADLSAAESATGTSPHRTLGVFRGETLMSLVLFAHSFLIDNRFLR